MIYCSAQIQHELSIGSALERGYGCHSDSRCLSVAEAVFMYPLLKPVISVFSSSPKHCSCVSHYVELTHYIMTNADD